MDQMETIMVGTPMTLSIRMRATTLGPIAAVTRNGGVMIATVEENQKVILCLIILSVTTEEVAKSGGITAMTEEAVIPTSRMAVTEEVASRRLASLEMMKDVTITATTATTIPSLIGEVVKATNIRTARTAGAAVITAPIGTREKLVSIVAVTMALPQIAKPAQTTIMSVKVLLTWETNVVRP